MEFMASEMARKCCHCLSSGRENKREGGESKGGKGEQSGHDLILKRCHSLTLNPPLSLASCSNALRLFNGSLSPSLLSMSALCRCRRVQCYNPIVKRQAQSQGSAKRRRRGAKGEKRRRGREEKTGHKMAAERGRRKGEGGRGKECEWGPKRTMNEREREVNELKDVCLTAAAAG